MKPEYAQDAPERLLRRLMPFEKWKAKYQPTDYQAEYYWRIKDELEQMAAGAGNNPDVNSE